MSDYTIISDISETLLKMLKANIEGLVAQDHISLDSPADIDADNSPRLTLYLYEITENQYLKNNDQQYGNSFQPVKPPLPLYLYYLLTAYAGSRESEQQILGKALQIFYNNNVIRGSMLRGSMAGTFDELVIAIHQLSLDDMNKLWNMFNNKVYKLSVVFRVSSALIDSTIEKERKRVIQKNLQYSLPE